MGRILETVADLLIECYDKLTVQFNPALGRTRTMFAGYCPVMTLSPRTYRETVLPADLHLRRQIQVFGLHHRGRTDLYLEKYKILEPIEFVEVGWDGNVAAVRDAFPVVILDLMMNVYDVQNMTRTILCETVFHMIQQAAQISAVRDIWVAEIGPDIPDEAILDFVEAVDSAFSSEAKQLNCEIRSPGFKTAPPPDGRGSNP